MIKIPKYARTNRTPSITRITSRNFIIPLLARHWPCVFQQWKTDYFHQPECQKHDNQRKKFFNHFYAPFEFIRVYLSSSTLIRMPGTFEYTFSTCSSTTRASSFQNLRAVMLSFKSFCRLSVSGLLVL